VISNFIDENSGIKKKKKKIIKINLFNIKNFVKRKFGGEKKCIEEKRGRKKKKKKTKKKK